MPEGSRVYQAVEAAGGFLSQADEGYLNLAAPVHDGMKITVYTREEAKTAPAPEALSEGLSGKVEQVVLRGGLGSHAACISTQGGISSEMEKVLNAMPAGEKVHAKRVLELNPEHEVFQKLKALDGDKERLGLYAQVLYGQALLLEGTPLEDPAEFARQVCRLIC